MSKHWPLVYTGSPSVIPFLKHWKNIPILHIVHPVSQCLQVPPALYSCSSEEVTQTQPLVASPQRAQVRGILSGGRESGERATSCNDIALGVAKGLEGGKPAPRPRSRKMWETWRTHRKGKTQKGGMAFCERPPECIIGSTWSTKVLKRPF